MGPTTNPQNSIGSRRVQTAAAPLTGKERLPDNPRAGSEKETRTLPQAPQHYHFFFYIEKTTTTQKKKKKMADNWSNWLRNGSLRGRDLSASEREAVAEVLGYTFVDPDLVSEAFRHGSFVNEYLQGSARRVTLSDNSRLEFLGDSALRLALAQVLYEDRPTATEGDLTTAKTKRESNAHLANCARAFGLYEFVRLGAGAQTMRDHKQEKVLAVTFEAVIGAVYLDSGKDLAPIIDIVNKMEAEVPIVDNALVVALNPRGDLQELVEPIYGVKPEYTVERVDGSDHQPVFKATVAIGTEDVGSGLGKSKKAAMADAAVDALANLKQGY